MEEIGNIPTIGGLFLHGEPLRPLQSPTIQPDVPIQDFSNDSRLSTTALTTLLSGRPAFQEHLHGSMIPPTSYLVNGNYEELDGSCKWDFNKISGFDPMAMNFDRLREFNNTSLSNELSLSLATSRPSAVIGSCQSLELTPPFEYHRSVQFPPLTLGSRYLIAIQDILTRVASYSLENFDPVNYMARFDDSNKFGSNVRVGYTMPMVPGRRKDQLLALLQAVDDQYNHCTDEIHTVISAFHAATELDPKIHAQFALQTISIIYKNFRERISNCILSMGEDSIDQGRGRDLERQWALHQLKRKEQHHHHQQQQQQQLWRVQRGLPEKSVSVLRTWMFDNFLHPYPKDAEKHLLALKSGLSRSQVSNWFINARVRLWKPMIEEMYAEMNRRKNVCGVDEEGTETEELYQ